MNLRRRVGKMAADITKCVHCHICRDSCAFLSKYNIDIGDAARLKELAYHCFLCGRCSAVCPEGIDGRSAVVELRRERVGEGTAPVDDKAYKGLLWEKRDYRFRNYRHAGRGAVLFPGCNFPSFYPRTMRKLQELLYREAGIGTVYDCCGKPVAELGLSGDEERIIRELDLRLGENGITEIIVLCPNCYHFLKGRTGAKVVSIYDKLSELGLGNTITGGRMFLPCPDRYDRSLFTSIETFITGGMACDDSMQCCGLGGSAGAAEPELAKEMKSAAQGKDKLYVYCASCAGNLTRGGAENVVHVLTEILGTYEKPAVKMSAANRAVTRFL